MNRPRLALVMMVKNEAAIICRAIESALPFIDSWSICDTGSTDGTQSIVRRLLGHLPGTLHEVPWVDFGFNRTQVLALGKDAADYLLFLDADCCLQVDTPKGVDPKQWLHDQLTADAYDLRYTGKLDYTNTRIFSSRIDWRYEGVTHEYPVLTEQGSRELPGVMVVHHEDGGNRADKFERDRALLEMALETDPDNPRTVFYLARSYHGLRNFEKALDWYLYRSTMDGFAEETWYAKLMAARIAQHLEFDSRIVRGHYLDAYFSRPSRLEAIYYLAQYCRLCGQHETAFLFSSIAGTEMKYPASDRLFIDREVYAYLMHYEFGVTAALTGRRRMAELVLLDLQRRGAPPEYLADINSALAHRL